MVVAGQNTTAEECTVIADSVENMDKRTKVAKAVNGQPTEAVAATNGETAAVNGASANNGDAGNSNGVKLRQKGAKPVSPLVDSNGNSSVVDNKPTVNGTGGAVDSSGDAIAALRRGMDALAEADNEMDEGTEEIRKLDKQLDHLNEYMDKVETRIKDHNEKLQATLAQQKEEREKRRKSFQERQASSQQEDIEFQQRMASMLNRAEVARNRQSIYEIISGMEIPKVDDGAAGKQE